MLQKLNCYFSTLSYISKLNQLILFADKILWISMFSFWYVLERLICDIDRIWYSMLDIQWILIEYSLAWIFFYSIGQELPIIVHYWGRIQSRRKNWLNFIVFYGEIRVIRGLFHWCVCRSRVWVKTYPLWDFFAYRWGDCIAENFTSKCCQNPTRMSQKKIACVVVHNKQTNNFIEHH